MRRRKRSFGAAASATSTSTAEQILKFKLQSGQIVERSVGLKLNQKINVTLSGSFITGNAPEDAHIQGTILAQ
jgi:hypothetical protein